MDSVPDENFMQFGYTNPNDTEGIMNAHLRRLARSYSSSPAAAALIGSPIAPLIKITGNDRTFRSMSGDIDFNAGTVLTGARTMDEAALDLADLVARTAAGESTKPERLGHREYFIMYKHQSTPSLEQGCRA